MHHRTTPARLLTALAVTGLMLTGCGANATPAGSGTAGAEAANASTATEAMARIVTTYDGGIKVLDGASFEVLGDFPMEGFNRVNPAGDGRHVVIALPKASRCWTPAHGARVASTTRRTRP